MARADEGRVGMNVSLTPELTRFVQERVRGGLYGSASEVVREALRLLVEREARREPEQVSEPSTVWWGEFREVLLRGERALGVERSRDVQALFVTGMESARARLRRENPGVDEDVIEKLLAQWLRERAGAPIGDGVGRPVSEERRRRILGE